MSAGYVVLGLQPVPVRLLGERGFGAAETVFARFASGLVLLVLYAVVREKKFRTSQPGLLFLRGAFGGVAVLLYFSAVQSIGAARATLLNYTYPIWANLFAVALGDRPTWRFWLWLGVASIGVAFVLDAPTATRTGWSASDGVALGSAISAGAAVLCIQRLRRTDDSATILASFSVLGLLAAAPFLVGEPRLGALDVSAIALFAAVGVTSFVGHLLFTRAYGKIGLAWGSVLSLLVPVVTVLSAAIFLDERLTTSFYVGGAIVLVAVFGVSRLESVRRPRPE